MSLQEAKTLDDAYVMHTFGRYDVEFVSGKGMTLVDDKGTEYLDFLSGIGVCCLGQCHPAVVEPLTAQAAKLVHVSNYFHIEHRGNVAKQLSDLADRDTDDKRGWKTFFANSGAEANECAFKLARLWASRTGKQGHNIVTLRKGFHGRTMETLAATMQDWLQDAFRPLPGGFIAGDAGDLEGLEALMSNPANGVVAVMFEPIQGESGVHPMSLEYMRGVRELCDKYDALMLLDEVQCGLFRTGKPFAFQLSDITPDIFSLAKGIAGGIPMGACLARPEVADAFRPGEHGSTFGGSNLACAVADSVLTELTDGAYDERATKVGAYLQERLATLPHVTEVRGAGLMVGAQLDDTVDAHDVVGDALLNEHLVINATGGNTLRFLPPLICENADVDALVEGLGRLLA